MKAEVVFTFQDLAPCSCKAKIVVVIDVLRATSVIATALSVGYNRVFTVAHAQEAFKLKQSHPAWHLAGERQAVKIPGFDFSNSPSELIEAEYPKDTLVLCTTNGTQALAKVQQADKIYALSFLNMDAVVQKIAQETQDLLLVCSGTHGYFSLDDTLAAAMFLKCLGRHKKLQYGDQEQMLVQWTQSVSNIHLSLQAAKHYCTLQQKGLQKDIDICLRSNAMPVVPQWHQGCFIL